ncbi:hypothetical protein EZV62_027520 [Acer yangbiense]|uniref:Uncharacterized protein n=1 Tax=Acer yangbiense TaxID=1000413 RepID=A0A5C7GVS6_9ROSI|nr:hypothetical protein EZV62_027520 [Acer yangbiense]
MGGDSELPLKGRRRRCLFYMEEVRRIVPPQFRERGREPPSKQTLEGLHLSQSKYALALLSRTNMLEAKPCSTSDPIGSKLLIHDGEALADASLRNCGGSSISYYDLTGS